MIIACLFVPIETIQQRFYKIKIVLKYLFGYQDTGFTRVIMKLLI